MRKLVLVVGCVLVAAMPAMAQEYPQAEIFNGYSLVRFGDGSPETFHGFLTNFTYNFDQNFGVEQEFGVQFKSISGTTVSSVQFLIGPRGSIRGDRFSGFVHGLVGGFSLGVTGFALAVGGGLDIKANERWAIRAVQFDYLPVRIAGQWGTQNFRVGGGVVLKIGSGD